MMRIGIVSRFCTNQITIDNMMEKFVDKAV